MVNNTFLGLQYIKYNYGPKIAEFWFLKSFLSGIFKYLIF